MEYLLLQPKTLETLAINQIGQWIVSCGKQISEIPDETKADILISQQIEIIRNHLCKLPKLYHNRLSKVLTKALNKIERTIGIKHTRKLLIGRMIETVFSENLTSLSLCSQIFFASLSKSYLLPRLTDLTFAPSSWSVTDDIGKDTIQFLKELHSLEYLNLSYCSGICSIDDVLTCIVEHCKRVEKLQLCYLECLSDTSMDILIQLENLRRVDLRETGVTEIGITTLLKSCKNIEAILADGNEIALALELIHEETPERQFNLTYYENCPETTLDQIKLVAEKCPTIQDISLTKFNRENLLPALKSLHNIRKLELYNYEFDLDNVPDFLEERGHGVIHLYLEDVEQIDLDALQCLSKTCPNIESLGFEDCRFEERPVTIGYTMFQDHAVLKGPLFNNLKRLSLARLGDGQALPTDEQIFYLLSSCPNVEHIITSRMPVTDDIMLKVLDQNAFSYLEVLEFRHQERLSPLILDRIRQSCVNLSKMTISEPTSNTCGRRNSLNTSTINCIL